jgi:hypothetical protein
LEKTAIRMGRLNLKEEMVDEGRIRIFILNLLSNL